MNWNGLKAYANPPWNMISRVLGQVRQPEATIVLVAPVWKTQTWYSLLLTLLIQERLLIPQKKGLPLGEGHIWAKLKKKIESDIAYCHTLESLATTTIQLLIGMWFFICLHHGRTQRGFEGGSPNPAGGLGGAVSPPAGSGAEPRKILKLTLFRG